jgi:hypothetical protein
MGVNMECYGQGAGKFHEEAGGSKQDRSGPPRFNHSINRAVGARYPRV